MSKAATPKVSVRDIWSARLRAVEGANGFPYLSDALFALVPVITENVETLAVDRWGRLYVNPTYFDSCTADQGAVVLVHEVWHLLLRHFERADKLHPPLEDADLINIAQDCEINIKDNLKARLPGNCCHPKDFGLPERGLFEEYYHLLKKSHPQLKRKIVKIVVHGHGQPGGGSQQGGGGGSKPQPSSNQGSPSDGLTVAGGRCGSCAHGKPEDYELPAPGEKGEDGKPCETPGVSPVKWEILARTTAQKIVEHSRTRGNVPGGWLSWAEEILTPVIDWRKAMPSVIQGMLGRSLGHSFVDHRRINRRQNPDPRILRPATVNALPNVDVVLDTSGSMSDKMLAQGIAEIGGILDSLGYAVKVNVHPTDACAAECQKVFRPNQIKPYGRGGTDMGVGIQAVKDRAEREPYDQPSLLIIISDCYTPWPEEAPPWQTLIVHIGGGGTIPDWAYPPLNDVLLVPHDAAG